MDAVKRVLACIIVGIALLVVLAGLGIMVQLILLMVLTPVNFAKGLLAVVVIIPIAAIVKWAYVTLMED